MEILIGLTIESVKSEGFEFQLNFTNGYKASFEGGSADDNSWTSLTVYDSNWRILFEKDNY